MDKNKFSALFIALVVILSIAGFTYAHWGGTVQIRGTVKMAHIKMTIKSEKVLTSKEIEKYSKVTYQKSLDGHTLEIHCTNLRPCWYVWIGLVTQNQGTLPVNVKAPEYSYEDPNGLKKYFETKDYLYGPYPENLGLGQLEVWADVKIDEELLPDGTTNFPTAKPHKPPFPADRGERVIVWIWIHCKAEIPNDANGKTITLYINIVDDIAI